MFDAYFVYMCEIRYHNSDADFLCIKHSRFSAKLFSSFRWSAFRFSASDSSLASLASLPNFWCLQPWDISASCSFLFFPSKNRSIFQWSLHLLFLSFLASVWMKAIGAFAVIAPVNNFVEIQHAKKMFVRSIAQICMEKEKRFSETYVEIKTWMPVKIFWKQEALRHSSPHQRQQINLSSNW